MPASARTPSPEPGSLPPRPPSPQRPTYWPHEVVEAPLPAELAARMQLLSINQVAASVDVTVRALQMAFRLHLGMTPAELIRRRRMEAIRAELPCTSGRESILDVATRWGMGSRSTLTQNYRQQFGEAPSTTLRQGGAQAPDLAARPAPARSGSSAPRSCPRRSGTRARRGRCVPPESR